MDSLNARYPRTLAAKGYQPLAEDRHVWLNVLEGFVSAGTHHDRLQNAFDCLVDPAGDAQDAETLQRAVVLADRVVELCEPAEGCLVLYSCADAWSHLHAIEYQENQVTIVNHPALLNELYFLRAAIQHQGFTDISADRRAKIYCNLGNTLSACGRWIEALSEWRRALIEQPILGMAIGNWGWGSFDTVAHCTTLDIPTGFSFMRAGI